MGLIISYWVTYVQPALIHLFKRVMGSIDLDMKYVYTQYKSI